jgi:hypothetical protein
MDSRIEELASIIQDRCEEYKKYCPNEWLGETVRDKYKSYQLIGGLAVEILEILHQFRCDHKELY